MTDNNNHWPETRESLVLRVKDPLDATAWSDFLAIYRPVVFRMARGQGLQHADAEDLAQQVFISIAGAIDDWVPGKDKPPFRSWLFRISRNAVLNALTRRKPDRGAGSTSMREVLHALPDSRRGAQGAGNDADNEALSRRLERECRTQALRWAADQIQGEFTKATWQMFWRTSIEGHPVADVAKDLNRSPGAVYMARYRVMQRLKTKVTELWSDAR